MEGPPVQSRTVSGVLFRWLRPSTHSTRLVSHDEFDFVRIQIFPPSALYASVIPGSSEERRGKEALNRERAAPILGFSRGGAFSNVVFDITSGLGGFGWLIK